MIKTVTFFNRLVRVFRHNEWHSTQYIMAGGSRVRIISFIFLLLFSLTSTLRAEQDTTSVTAALKKLSMEELMNIEVTSVSKTPQKLTEVASAIQVITNDDIEQSGATRLPEALRLAPNLEVAQVNSHDWAISARGFNAAPLNGSTLADKLLVMIDGRTIYTPLFGGVFWDVQNVLLEDVDRIEVVSGPGGTLWGDNAVNGVINVISKSVDQTQGLYASASAGSFLQDHAAVRYGGQLAPNLFYRVYGQFFDQTNTLLHDTSNRDNWNMVQGGFRVDYFATEKNSLTVQGDLYWGLENTPTNLIVNGQNILGRWTHRFSDSSDLRVQAYFDHTYRNYSHIAFDDDLKTYDLDAQHQFSLFKRNHIVWGAGFRLMDDSVRNSPSLVLRDSHLDLILLSAFLQDQITLVRNWLELTLGTKLSSNHYTGFEIQPSARLAFTPNIHNTIWAAVSRAVHTPSRIDADQVFPSMNILNTNLVSEKVIAYELGYRVEPFKRMAISVAGYYNTYTDLRSIDIDAQSPSGVIFENNQRAQTWGVELSVNYWIFDWWHLRGGYNYLSKQFESTSSSVLSGSAVFEGIDPKNQAMLQSVFKLPKGIQFEAVGRYTDSLPASILTPYVPHYFSLDLRLAWTYKKFEFFVVGKDLLSSSHREFGAEQIPRSIYGGITCRL